MVLPVGTYDRLTRLAAEAMRDVGQQAAFYVRQAVLDAEAGIIKEAYLEREQRRSNGTAPEVSDEDFVDGGEMEVVTGEVE